MGSHYASSEWCFFNTCNESLSTCRYRQRGCDSISKSPRYECQDSQITPDVSIEHGNTKVVIDLDPKEWIIILILTLISLVLFDIV
jgi:hypothetical protein